MDTVTYLELLSNDSANPCYFADMSNHDLLFANKAMIKGLKSYQNFQGEKCYKAIFQRRTPCVYCCMDQVKTGDFTQEHIFHETNQTYYRANSTMVECNGKKILFCKCFLSTATENHNATEVSLAGQEEIQGFSINSEDSRAGENLEKIQENCDSLTGFSLRHQYHQKLAQLQENPPKSLGVLFANLNGLRKTNEYFGYEVGDLQIKKTASILEEFFTQEFYRISGDEFLCFVENLGEVEFISQVDRLRDHLKETRNDTFAVGNIWAQGYLDVPKLVSEADTVMYINKQDYYFNSLKESKDISDSILQDLFRAIENQEFLVYLQPKVNLNTGEMTGAEALIRRYDKHHDKMIYPDSFIPLYEKNSIIRHVDMFVLKKVCEMMAKWCALGKKIPVSVNLSRVTLMEHGIAETVATICDQYGVPHHLIVMEVTERVGLIENDVASTLIDAFKEKGFKISLDDFGCAYSNIVTLAQISVDEVKIDKSLVDNLLTNDKNKIIVENMIHMCNELENTVTLAEGIEQVEQANSLRNFKCAYGQGFYYARPMPEEEFYEKFVLNDHTIQVK